VRPHARAASPARADVRHVVASAPLQRGRGRHTAAIGQRDAPTWTTGGDLGYR
jgi:hypothetical protein